MFKVLRIKLALWILPKELVSPLAIGIVSGAVIDTAMKEAFKDIK